MKIKSSLQAGVLAARQMRASLWPEGIGIGYTILTAALRNNVDERSGVTTTAGIVFAAAGASRMSASESPSLPAGWQSSENAAGGVDLRVADPRNLRRYFAAGVAVLAVIAGWRTFVNWQMGLNGSALVCLGITVLLSLFAIWCGFADERWHIEKNRLEHRLSIGQFVHSSRYQDAELEIVLRFFRNRPNYRLYAIANGRSHFLIDRDENALRQLAGFISFHTGWPIRPLANPPFVAAAMELAEEVSGKDREGDGEKEISDR